MAWCNHGGMGATTLAVPFIFSNKDPHRPPSICSPKRERHLRMKASRWERPYQRVKTTWEALEGNAMAQTTLEVPGKTGTVRIPEDELYEFRKFTRRYFGDVTEKGLRRVFRAMNFTRDTKLQQVEFVEGCRHIGYPNRLTEPICEKRRKKLFYLLDPDRSGGLDFNEFKKGFQMQGDAAPELRRPRNLAELLPPPDAQGKAERDDTVAVAPKAAAAASAARVAEEGLASQSNGTPLRNPSSRPQKLPTPVAMPMLGSTRRSFHLQPNENLQSSLPSSASVPSLPRVASAEPSMAATQENVDRVMSEIMKKARPLLREVSRHDKAG